MFLGLKGEKARVYTYIYYVFYLVLPLRVFLSSLSSFYLSIYWTG